MTVNVNLWAKSGNISLPGAGPVPISGFAASAAGAPQLPGPAIELMQGDNVEVWLTNNLSIPVSLVFPGQEFTPHPVKNANGMFVSYNHQTAPGSTGTYTFNASRPGIFLYESGTSQERQIQMGLYGVMIVRPTGYDSANPASWTAYGPGTGTEYDIEKVLVIGEVDTHLHNALATGQTPGTYNPDYFIINGRSYPDTIEPDDTDSQPYSSKVSAVSGQRVLLRIINAGFMSHNIRLQGFTARIVAEDSWSLKSAVLDGTYEKHTVTIGSGQSYDLLLTAQDPGLYLLYDRDLNRIVNNNDFPGGIMTHIEVI